MEKKLRGEFNQAEENLCEEIPKAHPNLKDLDASPQALLESGLALERCDIPERYHVTMTVVEVLDARGRIVRRAVPYQNPSQGLQPDDRLVGKRGRTLLSKVFDGLPPLLWLRLFWRRVSWRLRKSRLAKSGGS